MKRIRWYHFAPVVVIVASACALTVARAQKSDTRAEFMRQKLDFTKGLLDGLTRADFPEIVKNAKALKALSEAAVWSEPKLGSQTRYGWLSLEFQESTDEIVARANEKNLDGAALGYIQLVTNCMQCHRHMRSLKK